ncbi:MAG: nickel-dependent lactate racemase, partial [Acidimicrobiales bacterium]
MALQDRTPRPGLVLEVDKSTPPILFHRGEGFSLEKMPAGRTRVLYPAEPLNPLPDPDGAIRDALLNPLDDDPLPSKLFAGMKLTIVFDDVSLPLPQMRRPDIRQRIIEQVLDMAAEANVDDVHLIAALALHRRMTEDELRHAVGDRVYDAFAPSGLLYNMDAEDPDEMVMLGETSEGEEVQMVRRAAESDLIVYVNINMVSMNGGWKSTATGLSGYKGIRHHHNVDTLLKSSLMDHTDSEFHNKNWRQGDVIKAAGVKVFQVETTINNNVFGMDGPMSVLQKREWEWTARDRASFVTMQRGLQVMPRKARRKVFNSHLAPYGMTSVQAGEVEAVHDLAVENMLKQQLVQIEGQADILTMGLPYLSP